MALRRRRRTQRPVSIVRTVGTTGPVCRVSANRAAAWPESVSYRHVTAAMESARPGIDVTAANSAVTTTWAMPSRPALWMLTARPTTVVSNSPAARACVGSRKPAETVARCCFVRWSANRGRSTITARKRCAGTCRTPRGPWFCWSGGLPASAGRVSTPFASGAPTVRCRPLRARPLQSLRVDDLIRVSRLLTRDPLRCEAWPRL